MSVKQRIKLDFYGIMSSAFLIVYMNTSVTIVHCFSLRHIEKYDRMEAQLRLMCELAEGRRSGEEEGWITSEDVRNHFRARANAK